MQTNYTYTNLYPTINYIPLQDYDLMDEANIRYTLNEKLTSINFQENKINRSLLNIAISDPKYLNEFFSRYSGHMFYKKFQYPIASDYSYRDYFNNEAVHVDINANWIVFPCNEAGRCEEDEYLILVFDYEGRLIAPYNYKIRNLQSGLTVYVRKNDLYTNTVLANYDSELLSNRYTLKVVVIKKKNVTENLRYVRRLNSGGVTNNFIIDFTEAEMTYLQPLIDTNYYSLFKKKDTDQYYRPVHRVNYNTIVTDNKLLSFSVNETVDASTDFIILDTIDYSELNITTDINGSNELVVTDHGSKLFNYDLLEAQYSEMGYVDRIPLVTKIDGVYYPLPFKRVYDIYLWVNGIKLTPGVDYFIYYYTPVTSVTSDYNIIVDDLASADIYVDDLASANIIIDDLGASPNTGIIPISISCPPSIVLCEDKHFPLDSNTHIRVILNQPYHPKNLCAYFDNINNKGPVDFERDIVSYSANSANLAFSNGRFVSSDQIEILNNSLLTINNLTTNRRFEYNFNYLVNPDVSSMVDYFNNYESDLNKFIRYSGYSGNIINDYILYNNITNTLSDTYINELACTCASSNFSRFVNIEIDRSNTYQNGYVLLVTGLRLNNDKAVFDCRRTISNGNIKHINCNRPTNDCVLVIDCNR